MFGWSMRARACRSASNRATTSLGVHPGLDQLQGHLAGGPAAAARRRIPRPSRPRRSAPSACTGRRPCRGRPAAGLIHAWPVDSQGGRRPGTGRPGSGRRPVPPPAFAGPRRPARRGRGMLPGLRRSPIRRRRRRWCPRWVRRSRWVPRGRPYRTVRVPDPERLTKIAKVSPPPPAGRTGRRTARPGRRPSAALAVAGEIPRQAAASSRVSPAKYRSLTSSRLGRLLARASRSSASSRANRSSARRPAARTGQFVEVDPLAAPAVLGPALPAGLVDEDAAHGLGRGREEVPAAVPGLARPVRRPAAGTPRGPGPWPGGSGPASPGPAAGRPASAARRRRAGAVRPRPAGRRPRPRPATGSGQACCRYPFRRVTAVP